MIDMAHCRINMEDEEEYLDFYDFTKTYENHPAAVFAKQEEEKAPDNDKVEEASNESWEDCDEQSLDPADIDDGFQIVDDSEQSFSIEESKLGSPTKSGQ